MSNQKETIMDGIDLEQRNFCFKLLTQDSLQGLRY